MDLYVVQELFTSVSAPPSFISTLGDQGRLVPKAVESLLSVEPGSLVVTDLPYDSVTKISKRYIILHKDAVHTFLAMSDDGPFSRELALPKRPGYYLSTILCGARVLVSGFAQTMRAEAMTIASHAQQLGAEIWTTKAVEDILHHCHSNTSLYIVVPNCGRALQLLGVLLAHKDCIKNPKIQPALTDTDVQQIARAFVTSDLIYQLVHNQASPQVQFRLLASERFIPILYGTPLHYVGDESPASVSALLLAGATLVRSEKPQTASFYSAQRSHGISTIFAPSTSQKTYLPSSSTLYRIPRVFGQYKINLPAQFFKSLYPYIEPDISTIDQCKYTVPDTISPVGQGDLILSTLLGTGGGSMASYLIGERHLLQVCGYTQIVTYSEQLIIGLILMSLGCQSVSIQAKAKSIFKNQHSILGDNYLSIKYSQGRYSELITLLRARPIVCTFYMPQGFTPLSNALLPSINKALTDYIQRTILGDSTSWHLFRQSSLFAALQSGLQLPSTDAAIHVSSQEKALHEPSLKQSQGDVDLDSIWCKLQSNDKLLKDIMSMLLHESISFIPFSLLATLYPFVRERLFIIADPSLLIIMDAYLANSTSYKEIHTPLERAIPQILESMRQFYVKLSSDKLFFEKAPPLTYATSLSKDLETCALNGIPIRRSYSCADAVVIDTSSASDHGSAPLNTHFRSMIWLQLVIELLYADFINALLSKEEKTIAQTPFCLFSELTRPCPVCGSKPLSPDALFLLSSLCDSMHSVIEFTGLDLTKTVHLLGQQSPPGYLHWSMLAKMDAQTIIEIGETVIEDACTRIRETKTLCGVCRQLNKVFHPDLSVHHLSSYRQGLYGRIARTLITSLLLVWHDDNKLAAIAKGIGTKPENVSVLNFMCKLINTDTPTPRPNGVHFPSFLSTLFKERGNYGVAETRGRREYMLMYQAMIMAHPSVQQGISTTALAMVNDFFCDLESTAVVSHSTTVMRTEKSDPHLYNFTVPEDSYDDPRFQNRVQARHS